VLPANRTSPHENRVDVALDTPERSDPAAVPVLAGPGIPGRDSRDCRCPRARHRHGTLGAYKRDRCRCTRCRAANTAAAQRRRRLLAAAHWNGAGPVWVHPAGTRRRLQALTAAGWTTTQLASALGVTRSAVAHLRNLRQDRVLTVTAASVATLYDRLWWRTPPQPSTTRSERYAERHQWMPPWRWDGADIDDPAAEPLPDTAIPDEIAISEAIAGRAVRLTRAEQRRAGQLLGQRGHSAAAEIARLTGLRPRTIQRHRATDRAAA
jgi:transcriptional regulator with XRE-family HTH domain